VGGAVVGPLLMCLVCMYVRPRPGLDEDAAAELGVLTVCQGQLVCQRHVSCVGRDHHASLLAAVRYESSGQFSALSDYQRWRDRQDVT
jgi:hypothetical protein